VDLRAKILFLMACCLTLSASLSPQQGRREATEIALVANKDVPVGNLSIYEVRHVFMGETRFWKGTVPVVLIVPPSGTREREVMLHAVYRMSESQYRQYWIGRILRAEAASAPKTADSNATAHDLVASFSGCITIMNLNDVRLNNKIKILTVDGKSPGDKGYPLR